MDKLHDNKTPAMIESQHLKYLYIKWLILVIS